MSCDGSFTEAVDAGFLYLLQHASDGVSKKKPIKSVYVAATDTGLIKIGVSKMPDARIGQLEKSGGHNFVKRFISEPFMLAQSVELSTHKFFQKDRKNGEYFTCSFDAAVAEVKRRIGQLSGEEVTHDS
jgi:hypothetical protein